MALHCILFYSGFPRARRRVQASRSLPLRGGKNFLLFTYLLLESGCHLAAIIGNRFLFELLASRSRCRSDYIGSFFQFLFSYPLRFFFLSCLRSTPMRVYPCDIFISHSFFYIKYLGIRFLSLLLLIFISRRRTQLSSRILVYESNCFCLFNMSNYMTNYTRILVKILAPELRLVVS